MEFSPIFFIAVCGVIFTAAYFFYFIISLIYLWDSTHKPKILILGHGRHGKDTVAELLRDRHNISFTSSSLAAAKIFIFEEIKETFGYKTFEECYNDRNSSDMMRALWHNMICEYNKEDPSRLAKGILEMSDCYVGMRSDREIQSCLDQNLFDIVVFVDARKRLPEEPETSFDIDVENLIKYNYVDYIIDNNADDPHLELLTPQVDAFAAKFL